MQTRDFMSETVFCCTPETSLRDAARIMLEHDCGSVPVVDSEQSQKLIGMITDRDIVLRSLAQDRNPIEMAVGDCMTGEVFTVHSDTGEEELCRLMEQHQVRRIPVVDDNGVCIGIVSQADIARKASEHETAEVVKDISQPGGLGHGI